MAYSKELNLIYIHIPKCAGTSIIEAMKTIDPATDHGHKKWDAYDVHDIRVRRPKSFAIVRNPWDRAYSCYKYAIRENSYWHGNNKPYGVHSDYELLKNYDFRDAVKIFYDKKELLNEPANHRPYFKHNWDYQYPYIYSGIDLMVDRILHFETMDKIVEWLLNTYNLVVPKLNVSTGGTDYREHYDDEMIDLVGEIYDTDIALLNYVFE